MAALPVTILPAADDPTAVRVLRDIGGLTFDAVISESHVSELAVTENQLETGVSIADHCYMRQRRVTVNAVVSDIKMPSAPNLYDGSPSGRVRRAFELLQFLQTDLAAGLSEPFSITTGLKTYDDMVCTSLSATQDVTTASLLAFTAELTQVTFVDTAYAAYTKPKANPAAGKPTRQAASEKNAGGQQPETVAEATKQTLAKKLAETKAGQKVVRGFKSILGIE